MTLAKVVYAAAEVLLDEAIAELTGTTAVALLNQISSMVGDAAKWVTAAKTLKMRKALVTRLVDGKAAEAFKAIVDGGDFIDDAGEDFQFQYGKQSGKSRFSPSIIIKIPMRATDGEYQPNYYLHLMFNEKLDANEETVVDPRIRFYFYRQVNDSYNQDVNVYSCVFSESNLEENINDNAPDHYKANGPQTPYCVLPGGYYGRDHLNGSGIPPDGPLRTVFGLYPGGGLFDDNTYDDTQNLGTDGGLGAGILPVMLSSYVDFMRVEAALTLGTGEDDRALLKSAIEKSIAKVISFKDLVPGQMSRQIERVTEAGVFDTVEDLFVPSDSTQAAYVDFVLGQYDAAASTEDKLNILMKEYMIALRGNGLEGYNNYRRTGLPRNIQPALEPAAGAYARSLFYPAVHVDLNQNATQKQVTEPVFWDNNPAELTY